MPPPAIRTVIAWGLRLVEAAAGGDGPEGFDAAVADADVPVVAVDGGVAVTGDEAELVADFGGGGVTGDEDAAVFVAGAGVGEFGALPDAGHAAVDGDGFVAGIDDGDAGAGLGDDGGEHEEGVFEGADRGACGVEVLGVIDVHEAVAAGLDLVVDARRGFEFVGAGAGAADDGAGDALLAQEVHRAAGGFDGAVDGGAAFFEGAAVLGAAVVGLDAAEGEVWGGGDHLGEGGGFGAGGDAGAVHADVDFDEDGEVDGVVAGGGFDGGDVFGAVSAQRDGGDAGECGDAVEFVGADDFVADKDVFNAAPGQGFGLGDLLHALADGAAGDLLVGDDGGFVGLGVGAELDIGAGEAGGHGVEIELEGVEIDQEGGGVDLVLAHADAGGGELQHGGQSFMAGGRSLSGGGG